jgi:hypothetical protein
MRERGVLLTRIGTLLRMVTHLDVSRREVLEAIEIARAILTKGVV